MLHEGFYKLAATVTRSGVCQKMGVGPFGKDQGRLEFATQIWSAKIMGFLRVGIVGGIVVLGVVGIVHNWYQKSQGQDAKES